MHLTEEGVEVVFKLLLLKLGEPVVAAFVLNVAHGYLREVDLRRSKKRRKVNVVRSRHLLDFVVCGL